MREGVVERQGDLYARTGSKLIEQWHSKYFSQIFPFVMPRMVSGPDFSPNTEERWRRSFPDAPFVSIRQFVGGFARRIEAACRTDWMALPVMRSVAYKWVAQHTMSIVSSFSGKRNRPTDTSAQECVKAGQDLYDHLHKYATATETTTQDQFVRVIEYTCRFVTGPSDMEQRILRKALRFC